MKVFYINFTYVKVFDIILRTYMKVFDNCFISILPNKDILSARVLPLRIWANLHDL